MTEETDRTAKRDGRPKEQQEQATRWMREVILITLVLRQRSSKRRINCAETWSHPTCRKANISEPTYYRWKRQYGSTNPDEVLARESFWNLLEAHVVLEEHRQFYNMKRSHRSLGGLSPEAFARGTPTDTSPLGSSKRGVAERAILSARLIPSGHLFGVLPLLLGSVRSDRDPRFVV